MTNVKYVVKSNSDDFAFKMGEDTNGFVSSNRSGGEKR